MGGLDIEDIFCLMTHSGTEDKRAESGRTALFVYRSLFTYSKILMNQSHIKHLSFSYVYNTSGTMFVRSTAVTRVFLLKL